MKQKILNIRKTLSTDWLNKTLTLFWIKIQQQKPIKNNLRKMWKKQWITVSSCFSWNSINLPFFLLVLQKAGHHMEHTMLASYDCLLLGHLIIKSTENENKIRQLLHNCSFEDMIKVLDKYYNFMNLTASVSIFDSSFVVFV